MAYGTKIVEEKEHGAKKVITTRRVGSELVTQDDYQVMISMAIEAIRTAIQTGRKGDFGITFEVDPNKNLVKVARPFYTESVEIVHVDE